LTKPRKIIFPLEFIFTDRDYDRLGIDILKSRGYTPEIWDLSPLFKTFYNEKHKDSRYLKGDLCKVVSNKKHVYSLLAGLTKNDVVMSIFAVSNQNYFLYNEINKKNIQLGFFQGAYLPQLQSRRSVNDIDFSFKFIYKVFNKIYSILNSFLRKKISAEFVVTIGLKHSKEINKIFVILNNFYLLKSHSLDFDRYLRYEKEVEKNQFKDSYKEYIVFIDEAVTHHSDYDHIGIKPDCDESKYYYELNEFFDYFEEFTGIKILIAAHPKSNYKNGKDFFEGRDVIHGKTVELISNSKLVLLHASTSVNFAILYEKPLVYLTSKSYSFDFKEKIKLRASSLNLTPITLPLNEKIILDYSVDIDQYNFYLSNYIKYPGSDYELFWDTVCNYLDK